MWWFWFVQTLNQVVQTQLGSCQVSSQLYNALRIGSKVSLRSLFGVLFYFFLILLRSHVKAVTFSLVSFSLKIVILLLVFALFYQHSQAY